MAGIDTIARNHYTAPEHAPTFTREGTTGTDIFVRPLPENDTVATDLVLYHLQTTAAMTGTEKNAVDMINAAITIDLGRIVFTAEELRGHIEDWAGGRGFDTEAERDDEVAALTAMINR